MKILELTLGNHILRKNERKIPEKGILGRIDVKKRRLVGACAVLVHIG